MSDLYEIKRLVEQIGDATKDRLDRLQAQIDGAERKANRPNMGGGASAIG